MDFKELRKKYQGKYYLGYEINNSETFLFIKKVCARDNRDESSFMTYSDVIFTAGDYVKFEQNREWYFGTNFIESHGYKEIPRSLFMYVVNKLGFKRPKKNDKEYRTDIVMADHK